MLLCVGGAHCETFLVCACNKKKELIEKKDPRSKVVDDCLSDSLIPCTLAACSPSWTPFHCLAQVRFSPSCNNESQRKSLREESSSSGHTLLGLLLLRKGDAYHTKRIIAKLQDALSFIIRLIYEILITSTAPPLQIKSQQRLLLMLIIITVPSYHHYLSFISNILACT